MSHVLKETKFEFVLLLHFLLILTKALLCLPAQRKAEKENFFDPFLDLKFESILSKSFWWFHLPPSWSYNWNHFSQKDFLKPVYLQILNLFEWKQRKKIKRLDFILCFLLFFYFRILHFKPFSSIFVILISFSLKKAGASGNRVEENWKANVNLPDGEKLSSKESRTQSFRIQFIVSFIPPSK